MKKNINRLKKLIKMTHTYRLLIILIFFIIIFNLIFMTKSSRSRNEPKFISIRSKSKQINNKSISLLVNYESLCPDSENFIVNQLSRAIYIFRDNLNVQLIPFGKASYKFNSNTRLYEFNCQVLLYILRYLLK